MNTEIAEIKIIEAIKEWSVENNKLVIGIEGYSGAGKATLLKLLIAKYNFIEPVFMDDFVTTANTKDNLTLQGYDTELKLMWSPVNGVENLRNTISNFKLGEENNKVLVVEGIFLFRQDVVGDLLDKRIYLDCDKTIADTRRVQREKDRWGEKYFPETHPNSFTKYFKLAYKKYEDNLDPKNNADLVISVL